MFFDYPADSATFNRIIEQTNPHAIHFMNYDIKSFDEKDFLKTVCGMLKFAAHNNGGKVECRRFASSLGKSYAVLELLFEILEEQSIIKILEHTKDYYMIEYLGNAEYSSVLHSTKYAHLLDLIDECEAFQKSLLEDDLNTLEIV